jgi:hypothetical protein
MERMFDMTSGPSAGNGPGFGTQGTMCSRNAAVETIQLPRAEGDDSADGIVGRHANGHAISGYDLDSKTTHPAAQLCEDFMSRIALHAVKPARVHRDYRALHVNQIVFAQKARPFSFLAMSVPQHAIGRKSLDHNNLGASTELA